MKNLATSFVLLLIAAAIGGWIYFNERGPVSQTGATVLLRMQPQNVSSIAVQSPGGAPLEMTRQKNGWQVHRGGTNSIAVPADDDLIEELLHSTQLLQSSAVVDAADSSRLKDFGLAAPRGTLIVNDAKIEFGNTANFDPTKIYARVTFQSTPQIALLPVNLAQFVVKPFDAWRDKTALRVPAETISRLKIHSPQLTASFERVFKGEGDEEDQWRMLSPLSVRADTGIIQALLQQLNTAKTPQFLEDNPRDETKWGLKKPFATIEADSSAGAGSTLRIGRPLPSGLRAAQNSRSAVVFALPSSISNILARPLSDWRDRALLRFSTQDVQSLRIIARGQTTTLVKNGESWKRETSNSKTAAPTSDALAAQAALDVMIGLQGFDATDFVNDPPSLQTYGLDQPAVEIELKSSQWNAPKKARLAIKNGKVFAQVAEDGGAYPNTLSVLPPDSLQTFQLAFDALFGKQD